MHLLWVYLVNTSDGLHSFVAHLLEENGLVLRFLLVFQSQLQIFYQLDLFFINAVASTEQFLAAIISFISLSMEDLKVSINHVPMSTDIHRCKVAHNVVAGLPPLLKLVIRRVKWKFMLHLMLLFRRFNNFLKLARISPEIFRLRFVIPRLLNILVIRRTLASLCVFACEFIQI